jgi:hypothetical protein
MKAEQWIIGNLEPEGNVLFVFIIGAQVLPENNLIAYQQEIC